MIVALIAILYISYTTEEYYEDAPEKTKDKTLTSKLLQTMNDHVNG